MNTADACMLFKLGSITCVGKDFVLKMRLEVDDEDSDVIWGGRGVDNEVRDCQSNEHYGPVLKEVRHHLRVPLADANNYCADSDSLQLISLRLRSLRQSQ